MIDEQLDALIAWRDLSGYPAHKRLGNGLLSAWASLWAGGRLRDVESGYRIFRLGALADALQYYRGYKYSETVEVAVILHRLGYRVRNDVVVPVPLYRSRTRMIDAVIDLAVIPRGLAGAQPPTPARAGAQTRRLTGRAVPVRGASTRPRTPAVRAARRAAPAATPGPEGRRGSSGARASTRIGRP